MRITYHGPHDGVELAALHNVVVMRGQTIEVDDKLGASLVEQSTWDTSPKEILSFLGGIEDYDARVDWARRLLAAEQHGAQRTDVLEALQVWLDAQDPAGDPPHVNHQPPVDAGRTPPTPHAESEDPAGAAAEPPPDEPAAPESDDTAAGDQTPRTTRKGAK